MKIFEIVVNEYELRTITSNYQVKAETEGQARQKMTDCCEALKCGTGGIQVNVEYIDCYTEQTEPLTIVDVKNFYDNKIPYYEIIEINQKSGLTEKQRSALEKNLEHYKNKIKQIEEELNK